MFEAARGHLLGVVALGHMKNKRLLTERGRVHKALGWITGTR